MKKPNKDHVRSEHEYSETKLAYDYDFHYKKMKETKSGSARWGAYHWVFISRGVIGRYMGV